MSREEEILNDIQSKVKEYQKIKKAKEEKKKEKDQFVTKKEMKNILVELGQGKPGTEVIQPQQIQQVQQQQTASSSWALAVLSTIPFGSAISSTSNASWWLIRRAKPLSI